MCDVEFYINHAELLRFGNVYLLTRNKEWVVETPPNVMLFGFCHTAC